MASEAPKASLRFTPADKIGINLSTNETAKTTILVENTGTCPAAFKVKTTQPKRYLVKPNQGVLEPGASDRIHIQVVPKERQLLVQKPGSASADRFLVQCVACEDRLVRLSKESDELAGELTALWSSADKSVQATKFTVFFTGPTGEDAAAVTSPTYRSSTSMGNNVSADRLKELISAGNMSPSSGGLSSSAGAGSAPVASGDVMHMRKKYDDLVSYTVNLTAERDKLKNELEQTKKEYNKALVARIAAEKAEADGQRGGKDGTKLSRKQDSDGFSLIQLLLVALVCFLLGKYLHA